MSCENRPWWARLLAVIARLFGWLLGFRRKDDGDDKPKPPPSSGGTPPLAFLLLALLGLAVIVGTTPAAPVPEPTPVEGRGNRGLDELREPSGAARLDLRAMLVSCDRCHGRTTRPLYDGRRLVRPAEEIPRNIRWALKFDAALGEGGRRDLNLALEILTRR